METKIESNFQLRKLIKEVLNEIFDFENIEEYEIDKINNFKYSFEIDNQTKGNVIFDVFDYDSDQIDFIKKLNDSGIWAKLPFTDKAIFNVEVNVNDITDKFGVFGVNIYFKILKTSLNIIKLFIEDQKPDMIYIGSINDKKQDQFNAIIAGKIEEIPNWSFSRSNPKYGTALFNMKTIKG